MAKNPNGFLTIQEKMFDNLRLTSFNRTKSLDFGDNHHCYHRYHPHHHCVPAVWENVGQLEGEELGTKSTNVGDVEKLEVFKAANIEEMMMVVMMWGVLAIYGQIMITEFDNHPHSNHDSDDQAHDQWSLTGMIWRRFARDCWALTIDWWLINW